MEEMPSCRYQDPHAVALPPVRHAGAPHWSATSEHQTGAPHQSGEEQFQHTSSSCAVYETEIHQIKTIPLKPLQ